MTARENQEACPHREGLARALRQLEQILYVKNLVERRAREPLLVEPLLDKVLGEDIEVELLAGDSGFESRRARARPPSPLF